MVAKPVYSAGRLPRLELLEPDLLIPPRGVELGCFDISVSPTNAPWRTWASGSPNISSNPVVAAAMCFRISSGSAVTSDSDGIRRRLSKAPSGPRCCDLYLTILIPECTDQRCHGGVDIACITHDLQVGRGPPSFRRIGGPQLLQSLFSNFGPFHPRRD